MKILIIDDIHPDFLKAFAHKKSVELVYLPKITKDELPKYLADAQGLVVRSKVFINADFLELAPNLCFVARAGAGVDNIDEAATAARNILVFNAPEGNRNAVAEHTVAMLLMLLNKLHIANEQVRQGLWLREANRGEELAGKTVAIVGFGNNGRAFAQKLSGFGVRVLAYDKYKTGFGSEIALEVDMNQIFEQADVLSLHIPLTYETQNLVNDAYIQRFKKPFYLINVARGQIANLAHIADAVENMKILGACLDVLPNENLGSYSADEQRTFERLITSNKVVFSPHIAGWTHQSYQKIAEVLAEKILKIIEP